MRSLFTLLVLAFIGGIVYLYIISEKYPWDFIYNFENNTFYSFDTIKEDVIDTIGDQSGKDARAYYDAVSKTDEDLCTHIKSKSLKKTCKIDIVIQKAKKDGNETICDTLSGENNIKCNNVRLHALAMRTMNKAICDQITDNTKLQLECNEGVDSFSLQAVLTSDTTDERVCDPLGDSFFRECIQKIRKNQNSQKYTSDLKAITTNDCELHSKKTDKQECEDNKRFEKAKKTSDVTVCTTIETSEIKKKCLQQVSYTNDMVFFENATKNANLNVCNKIADTNMQLQCRDLVLLNMAQEQKNTAFCASIENATIKQECSSIR